MNSRNSRSRSQKGGGNNGPAQQKFAYAPVLGREVKPGWLSGLSKDQGQKEYRRHLFAAFTDARDRYVEREQALGGRVPPTVLQDPPRDKNYLTTYPPAPDFAAEKHELVKFSGCMTSKLTRFFTVDQENLKQYEALQDPKVKKVMKLAEAKSFVEEKKEHVNKHKGKAVPKAEEWVEPNKQFRVGMCLKQRDMKPIFFYSKDLHDAKYLYANIELYGDQYKASTMPELIELSSLIEKVTRFQKIISLMCFAQEKRFVAMHGFQQIASNVVEISSQAYEYRKLLTKKWLTNMLTDDEQPVVRSAFRSVNPDPIDLAKVDKSEARITDRLKKLAVFMKNRKMNRQPAMTKMIMEQEQREATGIPVDSITFKEGDKIQKIQQGQASIILDKSDNYKYITIENKTLETGRNSRQGSAQGDQQQNMMKKIQTGDISFISTDLDQTTQFDANNKLNKQSSYWIRLYGRVTEEYNGPINPQTEISPSQIGYDAIRRDRARYRVSVNMIKFPKDLAKQSDSKMTFQVKLYQFSQPQVNPDCVIECASQCIKIKGCDAGTVCPQYNQGQRSTAGIFYVDTLTSSPMEHFGIGLVIRKNQDPIALSAERLMDHEEMRSYESQQFFSYGDQQSELTATLQDKDMNKYEITFSVVELDPNKRELINERTGKKLLVGRYVIYKQQIKNNDGTIEVQNRVAYVKRLRGDAMVDIIETQTRSEHRVHVKELTLIEHYGVNVFQLNSEPELLKKSKFSFEVQIKTEDLTLLNTLQSKIRIHQASMNLSVQDTNTRDPLSTIEGDLTVAMVEVKGLIVPKEVNRRQMSDSNKCEPVVEILLQRKSELGYEQKSLQNMSTSQNLGRNRRDVYFGPGSPDNDPEFIQRFNQKVNHSGESIDKETKVEHTKKSMATVRRPTYQAYGGQDQDQWCIHVIVRNAADNFQEIGDAILEVDDVIDTELEDLAREHCVCLNRSHIIDQMKEKGKKGKYDLHTRYSGVMRFQTLFQPTRDTCLRFGKGTTQKRDKFGNPITELESPKQKLHLEYLLAKSDFDNFKYKIPQMAFNPNDKNFGEKMINLQGLIDQCNSKETEMLQKLLKSLQFHPGGQNARQQAIASLAESKIDEVIKVINMNRIRFESPFEKLYIIMKLKRRERPFLEQVFFDFRSTWGIYVQDVKNQGFSSLNQNEWYSFIDQLQGTQNFAEIDNVFSRADDAADDEDAKSAITDRSVSFIGETLKEMNNKSNILIKESQRHAEAIEAGNKGQSNNFSLLLTPEWEKNGQQEFVDLANLVMCGIPQALRTAAWGDFVRVSLIKIQEKKNLLKNFSQYAGQQGSQISQSQIKPNKKEVLPFQTLLDLSQKFDSIAFRQIDQDISDFKFPAHYYEETSDQSSKMSGWEGDSSMGQDGKISRVNKLKRDKQQMRKLLRVLLVWGKNFKDKGVQYQLSYPTGFLKVVHRFINLMSMEDAFWILIGFIRQFPRLWCLQESSMLDDAKSNYRFELTAIKAIVEVACPNVTQKLYQLGVCIETLVYDSMTCLYCDYFHSETLLRIWDMMFFYFATSERKRGVWLLLAPAILILKVKQQEIEQAKTAKDAIAAYREGLYKRVITKEKQDDCGEDYNPNQIIEGFNEVINEVFVISDKKGNTSVVSGSSSTIVGASTVQTSGTQSTVQDEPPRTFLANIFSGNKKQQPIPQQVDQVRRSYQESQNVLFDDARQFNTLVANFLFKNSDSAKDGMSGMGKQPVGKIAKARRPSEDSMDFENENNSVNEGHGIKPSSHTALEYRRWRQDILPAIQDQFLLIGGVPDDDLHEIEDTDIYQRNKKLDIRVVYICLHNLTNFYGTEDNKFQIQIYYGKLHTSGKFEKKDESEEGEECLRSDSNPSGAPVLQFLSRFNYHDSYNHLKINILTSDGAKICHCYVDLKGHQRGKFIHFKKQMNAKEYTENTEPQKGTTQISFSMFLEPKKEYMDQQVFEEEQIKLPYLYSLKRPEPSVVNIYKAQKEQNLQAQLVPNMESAAKEEFMGYAEMLSEKMGAQVGPQVALEMLNSKYKATDILPRQRNGHLTQDLFSEFIEKFLPEHARALSKAECHELYSEIVSQKQDAEPAKNKKTKLTLESLLTKRLVVDTERSGSQKNLQDQKMFSLRSFVFSVLNQSPLTVKEKLDLLYDMTSYCNKSIDGIDMNEAHMIYETILRQHLYYVPSNELRTQVENVFNRGQVAGITHAFWTSKFSTEIKYDMIISDENGCSLRQLLRNQNPTNVTIIDLTREIQETFVMYQNLVGNKTIDFNDDTSPFKQFANLFASQEETDIAQQLLSKTKSLEKAKSRKFRLCLLSQIASGERILTEVYYDVNTGKIMIDPEKMPDDESVPFQTALKKNINVLDLSGGNRALDKHEFIEGTMKIPLVYDLMRAETLWQDRKLHTNDISSNVSMSSKNSRNSVAPKNGALRNKTKFDPEVTVQISVKERNFIFKFVKSTIPVNTGQTQVQELNSSDEKMKTYKIELNCLYNEDIILDMRDKIVSELRNINSRGMTLDQDFISEVEGKMEFQVRKIKSGERNNLDLIWEWQAVNDFDRVEKFSDDEVFDNEVVFKLSPGVGVNEELLDETPQYLRDGYDCFSIYKHTDNSYEWRPCKIVKTEKKHEKLELYQMADAFGGNNYLTIDDSDEYFYHIEFLHNREEYGKFAEMRVKRRREDVLFSGRYARDQPTFKKKCEKFIKETYGQIQPNAQAQQRFSMREVE